MPWVYRIVKSKFAASAFTGEGARLYGGRWNSRGRRVIYAAENIALAALELMVHLKTDQLFAAYTLFRLELRDEQVLVLEPAALPPDWDHDPAPSSTARIGDEWLASARSLALRVPSVIISEEHNMLLNPAHPDFPALQASAVARPFQFDQRLGAGGVVG